MRPGTPSFFNSKFANSATYRPPGRFPPNREPLRLPPPPGLPVFENPPGLEEPLGLEDPPGLENPPGFANPPGFLNPPGLAPPPGPELPPGLAPNDGLVLPDSGRAPNAGFARSAPDDVSGLTSQRFFSNPAAGLSPPAAGPRPSSLRALFGLGTHLALLPVRRPESPPLSNRFAAPSPGFENRRSPCGRNGFRAAPSNLPAGRLGRLAAKFRFARLPFLPLAASWCTAVASSAKTRLRSKRSARSRTKT